MPSLEHLDLTDKALLWEVVRYSREGQQIVSALVEIPVRWEEGQFEKADDIGQLLVVDVVLATNQNIPLGSLLWEGSEEDLEELVGTSGIPESGIYEVVTRNRGKDLKGRVSRYEFGLKRFKDAMPDIAT